MRSKGAVKWFDLLKKFGFIDVDGGGLAFVHQNDLTEVPSQVLMKKDRVSFELAHNKNGLRAIAVQLEGAKEC